jgi:hypothetical protein
MEKTSESVEDKKEFALLPIQYCHKLIEKEEV